MALKPFFALCHKVDHGSPVLFIGQFQTLLLQGKGCVRPTPFPTLLLAANFSKGTWGMIMIIIIAEI